MSTSQSSRRTAPRTRHDPMTHDITPTELATVLALLWARVRGPGETPGRWATAEKQVPPTWRTTSRKRPL